MKKKLEKNPIMECMNIQNKFYPELFQTFDQVEDPRNQSYINYSAAADLILRLGCQGMQNQLKCKYTVMGWTAWDEVGMATDDAVKKVHSNSNKLSN